jgi:hypothetical protein
MITLEQKKQLQIDAGIPHLPTDLTYQCRIAIGGEGGRAQDWSDKPHRLVYDLSRQVEADAVRIEELERERDEWRSRYEHHNHERLETLNLNAMQASKIGSLINKIAKLEMEIKDLRGKE